MAPQVNLQLVRLRPSMHAHVTLRRIIETSLSRSLPLCVSSIVYCRRSRTSPGPAQPLRCNKKINAGFTDAELWDDRLMEGQRLQLLLPTSTPKQKTLPVSVSTSAVAPSTTDLMGSTGQYTTTAMKRDGKESRATVANDSRSKQHTASTTTAVVDGDATRPKNKRGKIITRKSKNVATREAANRRQHQRREQSNRTHTRRLTSRIESTDAITNSSTTAGIKKGMATEHGDRESGGRNKALVVWTESENDGRLRIAGAEARARTKIDELDRSFRRSVAL